MIDFSEQSCIRAAQKGDREAFARLVEAYQKKVYAQALWTCSDPRLAEDAAQEAFLSAWRALPSFRGESSFSTWLYRLTSNACTDLLRKENRHRGVSLDDADCAIPLPDLSADPQELTERSDTRERVRAALSRLPAPMREVLVLRELRQLRYDEIAQVLSLDEGTVKSRIHRARAQLRAMLTDGGNFSGDNASNETKEVGK